MPSHTHHLLLPCPPRGYFACGWGSVPTDHPERARLAAFEAHARAFIEAHRPKTLWQRVLAFFGDDRYRLDAWERAAIATSRSYGANI